MTNSAARRCLFDNARCLRIRGVCEGGGNIAVGITVVVGADDVCVVVGAAGTACRGGTTIGASDICGGGV